MLGWITKFFRSEKSPPKPPPPPELHEVGRAIVTVIDENDKEHGVQVDGYAMDIMGDVWIKNARDCFASYQERTGQTGMVHLGNSEYLPLCKVKKISVTYQKHQAEAT